MFKLKLEIMKKLIFGIIAMSLASCGEPKLVSSDTIVSDTEVVSDSTVADSTLDSVCLD